MYRYYMYVTPYFPDNLPSYLYSCRKEAESQQASIPLTGDSRADADILAFYKARQKLIQKGRQYIVCYNINL